MKQTMIPDAMPVLSPGRHRTPRKGACFMEFASYLAGERWSDHPSCTHPALAALARGVNDTVSDEARSELVALIPDVVGVNGGGRSLDLWIALHSAQAAIRVAPETRQRVLALAILNGERELAELEGSGRTDLSPASAEALGDVPGAHRWAVDYLSAHPIRVLRTNVAAVLENAVLGLSQSVAADRDAQLVELLRSSIVHCRSVLTPVSQPTGRAVGTGRSSTPTR
ncbi:hypothetical protein [Nocardioides sp.]|uniref:hypothetical protein n=1 Tax=Nocardioides sp. TaxID=35761 RepID=UPI003D0DA4B8